MRRDYLGTIRTRKKVGGRTRRGKANLKQYKWVRASGIGVKINLKRRRIKKRTKSLKYDLLPCKTL